jgi:hydroxyacylglutathione hydrolase
MEFLEEWMIIEQIQISGFEIFCYVLGDAETGEGIVVDPGGSADMILKRAKASGVTKIKLIVNTHSHVDHVAGNKEMQDATGAPLAIHELEGDALANPNPMMMAMFNAKPSPPATTLLKDGDTITFGNESVKVIHTPGHTVGGICLYWPGYVITGDTLFVGGVGRTDLPGGSFEVLQSSIRGILFALPDDTIVLPGHHYGSTPTSTIAREKRENVFV